MSDLVARAFVAVPRSEWAGGPAFTLVGAYRADVEPRAPSTPRAGHTEATKAKIRAARLRTIETRRLRRAQA